MDNYEPATIPANLSEAQHMLVLAVANEQQARQRYVEMACGDRRQQQKVVAAARTNWLFAKAHVQELESLHAAMAQREGIREHFRVR